jgi:hypothetical protein
MGYMPKRTGKDPKMNAEKTAKVCGIRLKIAVAGLSIACLGLGAALPAASHAFAPGPVQTTTTHLAPASDHLLPFVTTHSNGSDPSSPQATLI